MTYGEILSLMYGKGIELEPEEDIYQARMIFRSLSGIIRDVQFAYGLRTGILLMFELFASENRRPFTDRK